MKVPNKYYIWLGIGLFLLILVEFFKKDELNWSPTFSAYDEIPYGCQVIYEMAEKGKWANNIERSNKTFYEYFKTDTGSYTTVFIANKILFDNESLKSLLKHVSKGNTSLIASPYSSKQILDHFNINLNQNPINKSNRVITLGGKNIINDTLKQFVKFQYSRSFKWPKSQKNVKALGNNSGQANFIEVRHGKGRFLLSIDPQLFTNFYLIKNISTKYAIMVFSMLPPDKRIVWDDYLIYGNRKPKSEMRYVLSSMPMRIAFYMLTIILLLIIGLAWRRKQRMIPVIDPVNNTSADLVNTLTNLYLSNKNNKSIANYLVRNFRIKTNRKFLINWSKPPNELKKQLKVKSGKTDDEVEKLLNQFNITESLSQINQEQLIKLNKTIQEFITK